MSSIVFLIAGAAFIVVVAAVGIWLFMSDNRGGGSQP
jgi:hypothetical protein